MRLKPLNDNVIIKPDPHKFQDSNPKVQKALNEGFIVIPDAYEGFFKKASPTGKIVSWGNKCRYEHKVGDTVYFKQFAGAILTYDDVEYKVVNEWDLLGKVEDGSDSEELRSVS